MSPETTPESSVTETAVEPKVAKAKRASRTKKAVKDPAKGKAKSSKPSAKAPKTEKAPREKKEGLRKPQIRILKTLAKANKPLTRAEVSEKAPVDVATCVEYLGSWDDATRESNDVKHFPSLVSLGLVKHVDEDRDGRSVIVYSITAKGKAVAAKL
ncbi:MarR family winged helix-turn-helix transcriptional regulator [Candidatus Pacearchaeota archaeon]|jgi:hypothetical protein|nr:MarR family winged helix-turn-helix transcriptional regulator [Candidatus Pacearchaeota archaeon]